MININNYKNLIKSFISNKDPVKLFNLINCDSYFLLFYLNKLNLKNSLYISNSIKNIKLDIKFLNSKINSNTIFQKVLVKKTFKTFSVKSNSFDYYYFIISCKSEKYVIDFVIAEEEFPTLFNLIENNLDLVSFNYINLIFKEKANLYGIPSSKSKNINTNTSFRSDLNIKKHFNIKKAIYYAEKYSLKYNPDYKSFDGIGGDCTNFVSQIINYANIKTDDVWKPYTYAWIRVNELRDYLINNNLACETDTLSPNSKGAIIQFFHPERKVWSHTGFITHCFKNDFLYCCHSYDKLNYPLSLSYPYIYPKIRIINPY